MLAEQQTEWIISNNLVNKGWHINGDTSIKNVYFQKPKLEEQRKKLNRKKPDYILYKTGTDIPIAIIEAKKGGTDLGLALKQGEEYAKSLNIDLVFAMNGAYCETLYVPNGKSLVLNGEEVRELIREKEALEFLNKKNSEVWTIPKEVKISREELIKQFGNLNDVLRSEGLRAGIERFSEFSNILFLKLLSEDNEKSWWNSIKSQSNDDIIGYINDYVIKQIQEKYGGDVFTPISIKNPQTLRHIIDVIDPLILSTIDTDIKGDAFEYFLEKTTSTENDLGEYFTPRNVVKTIINLVDPKFKETVYDPFCGTGGFLTEAFNYIKDNNIIEDEEDLRRLKENTLYGGEITSNARIAKMNLILHGDGHSGIKQINSLENPDYKDSKTNEPIKFDIIVTNMPFSQTITRKISDNGKMKIENNISPLYYNGIAKNNGDSACVLHCLRNLKKGGRMALVVPEGFLFRKDIAKVREFLLSKAKLQSVISLPQGTFLPYTPVKTDILYFINAHMPNSQNNYWFFEAKNIGLTLDNHKRKIKGINDFNKIDSSDIKNIEKKPDLKDNMLEIGFEIIDLEKVRKNDYNLVGNYYREAKISEKYDMMYLSNIIDTLESGTRPKGGIAGITEGAISLGGEQIGINGLLDLSKIPFVSIDFYKNAKRGYIKDNDILICKDGALTGKTCIVDFHIFPQKEVMVNEHIYILRGKEDIIYQDYLFFCLSSKDIQTQIKNLAYNKSAQPGLNREHIEKIQIPIPTLEEQKIIVDELNSYKKIIDGAENIIKNYKPIININSNWDKVNIGELCKLKTGGTPNTENRDYYGGEILWLVSGDIHKEYIYDCEGRITNEGLKNSNTKLLEKDSVLIALNGQGKTRGTVAILKTNATCNQSLVAMEVKDKQILDYEYLYYFLRNKYQEIRNITGSEFRSGLNMPIIKNIQIYLPDILIQKHIVKELEIERKMIESQKEIIMLFQQKIENKLKSLWLL